MKIAMFGGSFDPVHNDHIALCSMMLKKLDLDKVVVLPAFCSPFKAGAQSSDLHRLNMCRLAFEDVEGVEVSDFEINKGGKSYTVDSLKFLKEKYKNAELFLIMGADAFMTLSAWFNAQDIFALAHILTVVRGEAAYDTLINKAVEYKNAFNADCTIVNSPVGSLSSTYIRNAIKIKADLSGLLPEKVADYIKVNRLYGYAD